MKQPGEQKTFFSNLQRWLFNAGLNAYSIMESDRVQELIARYPDDKTRLHKGLQLEINQISDVPGADPRKKTLAVLASGPSLMDHEKFLPWVFKHCYTIASPTQLPWLMDRHLTPDVVIAVDAHPILAEHTERSGANKTALLVCSPEVTPRLPMLFGRDRTFWFRTGIGGRQGKMDTEPYSVFMTFLNSAINVRINQAGCVTNMALMLAMALKEWASWEWDRIILLGCDYAFVDNKGRVPTHGDQITAEQVAGDLSDAMEYKNTGIRTNGRMVRYKAGTLLLWAETMARIYTMSRGILDEFPPVTEAQVRRGEWPEYLSEYKIGERVQYYMRWFQKDILKKKGSSIKPPTAEELRDFGKGGSRG